MVAHFTGKNCTFKFFMGGKSIGELDVRSFSCKPNIVAIADGVCGENRDRLDKEVNYYELTMSCFQKDLTKLKNILADQDAEDDGAVPTVKDFAMVIKTKGGEKGGYIAQECVLDDWNFDIGGRTDRVMLDLPIRCRYFKQSKI